MSVRETEVSVAAENAELPEGWASAAIEELFDSWGGATPSTSEGRYWGGEIPWISSKDVKTPTIERGEDFVTNDALAETRLRICPVGSVLLVVRSGILASKLPIAVTTREVVINQDLKALYSPEHDLNRWLALALNAESQDILRVNRKDGTTVQSIKFDEIKNRSLRVPPLAEQRRIVAAVEALLAQVNAARERLAGVPSILKRFRQSVLAAACSGRLTEDWREKHPDIETAEELFEQVLERRKEIWSEEVRQKGRDPQRANYPPLCTANQDFDMDSPDGWKIASMDALTCAITSGSRDWKRYYVDDGPGTFIMAQNVRPLFFDRSYRHGVDPPRDDRDRERSQVARGDLLVTIVGANTGDVCRIPEHLDQHYVCQSVALMRPVIEATSNYLEIVLNSPMHGQGQYRDWIYGEGRPHLSFDHLRSTAIPLPPLEEQHEIVRRVEALFRLADAVESRVAAATQRAEKLTQAILAKAFRGELVETEAQLARREGRDYEPASVLLERIRAEREAEGTVTRPRTTRSARRSSPPARRRSPDLAEGSDRRSPADGSNALGDLRSTGCAGSETRAQRVVERDGRAAVAPAIDDIDRDDVLAVVRDVFSTGGPRDRDEAIREVAHALGYQRTGSRIHDALDKHLQTAVRRGILENTRGELSLLCRHIDEYERDHLIDMLLAAIGRGWCERPDAIRAAARHLGYRRTGKKIEAAFKSAINAGIRRGLLERDGGYIRRRQPL